MFFKFLNSSDIVIPSEARDLQFAPKCPIPRFALYDKPYNVGGVEMRLTQPALLTSPPLCYGEWFPVLCLLTVWGET